MTWIRVETAPGWYTLRCVTWISANPSSITLAAGDMRFVEVEGRPVRRSAPSGRPARMPAAAACCWEAARCSSSSGSGQPGGSSP